MAKILAIDTSTAACSVALADSRDSIREDFRVVPQSHTQCLLPMIDNLLAEHQLTLTNLDAIALTLGPGSFTGLRIGLGIIQGLAFGADLPVIGTSSLRVMSSSAQRLLKPASNLLLLPSLDARMQEVYWACYQNNSNVDAVEPDRVSSPDALTAYVEKIKQNGLGIGDGWSCLPTETVNAMKLQVVTDFYPHAYDVAVLALADFAINKGQNAAEVQPLYIRNEVSWKKRQRIRQ